MDRNPVPNRYQVQVEKGVGQNDGEIKQISRIPKARERVDVVMKCAGRSWREGKVRILSLILLLQHVRVKNLNDEKGDWTWQNVAVVVRSFLSDIQSTLLKPPKKDSPESP